MHVLVPAGRWPDYECLEHDGAGWGAKVVEVDDTQLHKVTGAKVDSVTLAFTGQACRDTLKMSNFRPRISHSTRSCNLHCLVVTTPALLGRTGSTLQTSISSSRPSRPSSHSRGATRECKRAPLAER